MDHERTVEDFLAEIESENLQRVGSHAHFYLNIISLVQFLSNVRLGPHEGQLLSWSVMAHL